MNFKKHMGIYQLFTGELGLMVFVLSRSDMCNSLQPHGLQKHHYQQEENVARLGEKRTAELNGFIWKITIFLK